METLQVHSLSVKPSKQADRNKPAWVYCVIKSGEHTYCTKSRQTNSKEHTELIGARNKYSLDLPHDFQLFKLELWNYDTQQKIGEIKIGTHDIPVADREKEFYVTRDYVCKICYERKNKCEETTRNSQSNTLRISYNKSDPNLTKVPLRVGSPIIKKLNSPEETPSKADSSSFGKWRYLTNKNESQRLKL